MTQVTSTEPVCLVFVGSTGTGKSTITNELTPTDTKVEISSSTDSCTKGAHIFESTKKNVLVIDTQGFEDSENEDDLSVLLKTIQLLAEKSILNIKILWIIKPQNRGTPTLQRQAKFVNALSDSVWKSVILICKQGSDSKDYQGALSCIKNYTNENVITYGLHILDAIEDVKNNDYYSDALGDEYKDREEEGFLYKKEVTVKIFELLDKIQDCRAKLKKQFYHDKPVLLEKIIHKGELVVSSHHERTCKSDTIMYHKNKRTNKEYETYQKKLHKKDCKQILGTKHNGKLIKIKYHKKGITQEREHPGSFVDKKHHPGQYYEPPNAGMQILEGIGGLNPVKLIEGTVNAIANSNTPSHPHYQCCKSSSKEGCKVEYSYYTCCENREKESKGCQKGRDKYLCCGVYLEEEKEPGSEGCGEKEIYKFCKCKKDEEGCMEDDKNITWSCGVQNGCDTKVYYICCDEEYNENDKEDITRGCLVSKQKHWSCSKPDGCQTDKRYPDCGHTDEEVPCYVDYKYWECCEKQEDKDTKLTDDPETFKYPGCDENHFKWIPGAAKL